MIVQMKGQMSLLNESTATTKPVVTTDILRERLDTYGTDFLMDEEVISLLTSIPVDTVRTAINDFGLPELSIYADSLGISKTQKRKLELLNQFYKRMATAQFRSKPIINSSTKAGEFCKSLFIGRTYEAFFVICLDAQNRVNRAELVHEGTINEAPVYPRLIVEAALKYKSNAVIVAHNHPGGSLSPSGADVEVTKKLSNALQTVSIKLVDHVIIAEDKYYSFAEKGLM